MLSEDHFPTMAAVSNGKLTMAPPDSERLMPMVAPAQRAPRVISAANAWLMDDIMADVIKRGTGHRAVVLGRSNMVGKPMALLLLDANDTNNSYTLQPAAGLAASKWALTWMVWLQDLLLTYAFLV